ncbi:DUF456 domain-containing protein [Pseudoxanthomonas composti]|uniref:DUF456 domain-containing protein n=1 Tax=Pseudoxanthomonas composti TaxID=2137479 RepID=A0A4Q1JY22_9GAMM|nr:DUF456 domain-containing protein [Pseudoxanthomonas composti]RXR07023.1 DUF456 domain-containing protein [Pseudoxanthomonas composti]
MDLEVVGYIFAAVLMVVGIAGIILPVLPGLPVTFLGMLLAAWLDGFARVGWVSLVVLGVMTALSVVVDILSSVMGARRVGASRKALVGAALGTVAGLFFGPIGIVAGPFLGALLGELWHGKKLNLAARVGLATWIGMVVGMVLKLGLGFAMLGWFLLAWFL